MPLGWVILSSSVNRNSILILRRLLIFSEYTLKWVFFDVLLPVIFRVVINQKLEIMKRNFSLVLVLFALFFKCEPDSIPGCTDSNALNKDSGANENDGSCHYSEVTFYSKFGFFNGIPITKIAISVEDSEIGVINGTIYPNGPGNCSAPGNVKYVFNDGNTVDWNSIVYLANGGTLYGSGNIEPSQFSECIKVNVTN